MRMVESSVTETLNRRAACANVARMSCRPDPRLRGIRLKVHYFGPLSLPGRLGRGEEPPSDSRPASA